MTTEELAEIRACIDSWSGKRDAEGYIIEGPEWDVEDIVRAFGRLLAAFDGLNAEHRRALDLIAGLSATLQTEEPTP
jgi:hypothetical protein